MILFNGSAWWTCYVTILVTIQLEHFNVNKTRIQKWISISLEKLFLMLSDITQRAYTIQKNTNFLMNEWIVQFKQQMLLDFTLVSINSFYDEKWWTNPFYLVVMLVLIANHSESPSYWWMTTSGKMTDALLLLVEKISSARRAWRVFYPVGYWTLFFF